MLYRYTPSAGIYEGSRWFWVFRAACAHHDVKVPEADLGLRLNE